ncbi:hypothetical protein QFC21_002524 [Naganishia friedmannii]|uniref:Uncharacterized protein n=1 Tax=Naganishia friedmannii TaxID=89922 RepID=A0ACC2VUU8_9TREE|nr:hypothetical protein QFC21_002524 [Naganishia friedmannii]
MTPQVAECIDAFEVAKEAAVVIAEGMLQMWNVCVDATSYGTTEWSARGKNARALQKHWERIPGILGGLDMKQWQDMGKYSAFLLNTIAEVEKAKNSETIHSDTLSNFSLWSPEYVAKNLDGTAPLERIRASDETFDTLRLTADALMIAVFHASWGAAKKAQIEAKRYANQSAKPKGESFQSTIRVGPSNKLLTIDVEPTTNGKVTKFQLTSRPNDTAQLKVTLEFTRHPDSTRSQSGTGSGSQADSSGYHLQLIRGSEPFSGASAASKEASKDI